MNVEYSKHFFHLKGTSAEKVVHELAVKSFFTDWCYLNPRLEDGKELCDLLVVFDHTAIIWQIKDLKLRSNGFYNPNAVKKNLRQLSGAARRLKDGTRPIILNNPRRGRETFDPTLVTKTYLISVLAGDGEEHSSGMETSKDTMIHVFTKEFMGIVLNELDTISDFLHYIQAKETLFGNNHTDLVIAGGEEELLATYIFSNKTLSNLENATSAFIDGGVWEHLQASKEYQNKKAEDLISYGWDSMIDRAHEGGTPEYERIAREMARPDRFARRCLAKGFHDAHKISHNAEPDIFRRVMPYEDRTYCFLFADDPEPRTRRRAMLQTMCYIARGTILQNKIVIGIATEKQIKRTCTYDFCLLEYPQWTDEDTAQVLDLQQKTGILTNPSRCEVHEDEYPRGRK